MHSAVQARSMAAAGSQLASARSVWLCLHPRQQELQPWQALAIPSTGLQLGCHGTGWQRELVPAGAPHTWLCSWPGSTTSLKSFFTSSAVLALLKRCFRLKGEVRDVSRTCSQAAVRVGHCCPAAS